MAVGVLDGRVVAVAILVLVISGVTEVLPAVAVPLAGVGDTRVAEVGEEVGAGDALGLGELVTPGDGDGVDEATRVGTLVSVGDVRGVGDDVGNRTSVGTWLAALVTVLLANAMSLVGVDEPMIPGTGPKISTSPAIAATAARANTTMAKPGRRRRFPSGLPSQGSAVGFATTPSARAAL
jgi:hypothetical protein